MTIIRVKKTKDYTVMSNYHLRDKNLSLKAKGLMSIMLSLPDDWDYTVEGLVLICKEKQTSIESALKELKDNQYLIVDKKFPNQTKSGRIEYDYILFEQKQEVEKQGVEFLGVEFLGVENQPQLNTNILNTEEQIKEKENIYIKEKEMLNAPAVSNPPQSTGGELGGVTLPTLDRSTLVGVDLLKPTTSEHEHNQDDVTTLDDVDPNSSSNCALRPSYERGLQLRDSSSLDSRPSNQPDLSPTNDDSTGGGLPEHEPTTLNQPDPSTTNDGLDKSSERGQQLSLFNEPVATPADEKKQLKKLEKQKAKAELDKYILKIFNDIWLVYPRQEERADAKKAFLKFMKGVKTTEAARERAFHVYLKAKAYNEKVINDETETRYIKKFRRWLEANFE